MLNADRAARRQQAVAVRIARHAADTGPDVLSTVETTVDLARAWGSLSPADQEVLALHVWDDLSDRDAATVLGCTRAAYSMRLIRSRRRLSRIVGLVTATSPTPVTAAEFAGTELEQP